MFRRLITNIILFCCLSGCISFEPRLKFGIQDAFRSYIPARTAVFSCRLWPTTSNFPEHPASNVPETELKKMCQSIDNFVLQAFNFQPYMKGFTPKAIGKFLDDAKKSDLLKSLEQHWRYDPTICKTQCDSVPSFYQYGVKERTPWRYWLADFSAATHASDAILLPFITFGREERENDRGLLISRRVITVVLLLIDTLKGELIWAGQRQGIATAQTFTEKTALRYPDYPEWSAVMNNILLESLWREYPGRTLL